MSPNHLKSEPGDRPHWRYLLLAFAVLIAGGLLLAALWQVAGQAPGAPIATPVATRAVPSATPSAYPSPAASPTPAPSATPAPTEPRIVDVTSDVDEQTRTVVLQMAAQVPADRQVDEALLWYSTETGSQLRYFPGPLPADLTLTYELDAAQEGLTTTLPTGELDYWWLVRDTAGEAARAGATVALGPAFDRLFATPAPAPPPVDFTWQISRSEHYDWHYVAGSEAERDLPQLMAMAEAGLSYITPTLEVTSEAQLTMYLTPRVFWQGGAAYAGKTILISYLDRNYTAVDTWSYFTHEATHALAQDLIQPKEEEGGPDGVLVEGLAVWATGGHYGLEPIDAWAAAITASEQYIPLAQLRKGPFYDFQHEIAYLEAGSFVKFLIERNGLDVFKTLYGLETGDAVHDEVLVQRLYGASYSELEQEWLAHLATVSPAEEETERWWLQVRAFDLMRRYQTEQDPDARILPGLPTEWQSDTLKIFTQRPSAPVNLVLETALVAAHDRARKGDLHGAGALLDDVEAALDAGGSLDRPSLAARQDIVSLLAAQDRAVLRADAQAYRATLEPDYALALGETLTETLAPPYTVYWQEVVRLDVADDGQSATGQVMVHGWLLDGLPEDNGHLYAVRLVKTGAGWRLADRQPARPELIMPPPPGSR